MLSEMAAKVEFQDDTMVMTPAGGYTADAGDLVHRMRASNYMMGALLARFGKAEVSRADATSASGPWTSTSRV